MHNCKIQQLETGEKQINSSLDLSTISSNKHTDIRVFATNIIYIVMTRRKKKQKEKKKNIS